MSIENFKCEICGKQLKNLNLYNSHITFHKNKEKYPDGINCPLCNKHCLSIKGLYKHCTQQHSKEEQQFIYRKLNNDEEEHLCENCKKPSIFINTIKGFAIYCSEGCRISLYKKHHKESMEQVDFSNRNWVEISRKKKETSLKRWGVDNPAKNETIKKATRETCQKRYKADAPMGNKDVQNKTKKTNLETYGYEWHLSSPEIIKKREDNLTREKGVKNVFQLDDVKEKIKKTNLKLYGCENPTQNKDIQLKIVECYREKYGVDHPSQTYWFQEKRKISCIEKYNVDHFSKTDLFKAQFRKTSQERWGTDSPTQNEEIKKKIRETNNFLYGGNICFADPTVNEKRKITWKNKGYNNPYQSGNVREIVLKNQYNRVIDRYKEEVIPLFTYEEWKTDKEHLQWKCKSCNCVFTGYPYCGHAPRCLNCYPLLNGFSAMEKELVKFIKDTNIECIENSRTIIKPLELDIYIPTAKLAIEFDGLYWHSEKNNINSNYHLNKTEVCASKGIHLIHIFENEWLNKKEIVKSLILSQLGIYNKKIGARECIIQEVSSKDASIFYNENHIQGAVNSSINLGLFYKGELVSCLSFSKPRFNKKYDWEITRFANKINYSIAGAFSRLWKQKPIGSIITYSDKRYFKGNIYKKYMTQLEDSKPSYYYIIDGNLENRIKYQKHKLKDLLEKFDPLLTEEENMYNNGFFRIWDCGNYVFEYKS